MKFDAAIRPLARVFKRSLAIVRETLQEIFEESAYARFLERRGIPSSREAYANFLRETESSRVRRPRCC
jgi:hypothetical protein